MSKKSDSNEVPESVRSLIRKVHALVVGGVGGEAEAAQRKLTLLLEKHGVTLEEVAEDLPKTYEFKFKDDLDERLIRQCYVSIDPKHKAIYTFKRGGRKVRNLLGLDLTPAEYVDFKDMLDYYRKALKKEIDRLYSAFVHKHDLFPTPTGEPSPKRDVDPEEVAAMIAMMKGLREQSHFKPAALIGNGGDK